jgi:hypothetical protein
MAVYPATQFAHGWGREAAVLSQQVEASTQQNALQRGSPAQSAQQMSGVAAACFGPMS